MTTPETEVTQEAIEPSPEERIEALLTRNAEKPDDEEPEGQAEESDDEGEEEAPEQPEEELVEIEFEGKKATVPKELKNAFLREADYTRKTQEVAREREAIAQERQMFELNRQLEAVIADDIAEVRSMQSQVKNLEHAMNRAYQNQDPASLATFNAQYTMLQNQLAQKVNEVHGKKNQQAQLFAYQQNQRLQQGYEKAKSLIPNFNEQTQADLRRAAEAAGYAAHEIDSVDDARALHVLWKAHQWDKLQSGKPATQKRLAEAPKTLKPHSKPPAVNTVDKQLRSRLKEKGRVDDAAELLFRRMTKGK